MYFFYFLPLGLEGPPRRVPWLTGLLLAAMAAVFVWARYLPGWGPLQPYDLVFFAGSGRPWTVFAAVFLHAQWLHFLGNALYLWIIGSAIEARLGRGRLLLYLLIVGAAGNLAHGWAGLSGLMGEPGVGVMGASGAIAGLLGIALVRFPWSRLAVGWWLFAPLQGMNRAGRAMLPLPAAVLLWVLLQVVRGLTAAASGSTVSHAAHLGGFLAGLGLALALGLRREGRAEGSLVRGRRYLEGGQALAAEGCFLEYLDQVPGDREARLQLARSRRMAGRQGDALVEYRRAFREADRAGDLEGALEIYREVRRGGPVAGLTPDELARTAFLLEKQGRWRAAVEAYLDLYGRDPDGERGQHGIVRAVVLFRGRLHREDEARRWLAVARQRLRPGPWRDFLEREFRPERGPRAGAAGNARGWRPEPAAGA